jgi:hypothetical protein
MGTEYQCSGCRSIHFVNAGPVAFYILPDGREFFGPHGTGWCLRCRLLAEVEEIPASVVLQERLSGLRRLPDSEAVREAVEHWTALLDWSLMRRQPPRCLRCGCLNFTRVKQAGECLVETVANGTIPFRHPRCGGVFRVKQVVFARPVGRCLTADGSPADGRWDGGFVRWVRRLLCWVDSRFR